MPYVTSAVPISFQELEDSEWRPLTAGAGDGWGGACSSDGPQAAADAIWPVAGICSVALLRHAFKGRGPSVII